MEPFASQAANANLGQLRLMATQREVTQKQLISVRAQSNMPILHYAPDYAREQISGFFFFLAFVSENSKGG